jgi:hypothetical protein
VTTNDSEPQLTRTHLKWAWGGAFVVTALFGFGLTPWETIGVAMGEVDGVDRESLVAFAAGYTLPAAAGFALIVWLAYSGAMRKQSGIAQLVTYSLILVGTAALCQFLGLGLLPDFAHATFQSGPFYVAIPVFVLSAYLNSYGWGLMLTAAAIGVAAGLHVGFRTGRQAA